MKDPHPPLGDLEHELLAILWVNGALTAVDVRRKVGRRLKDPTIRTVLRRLEKKGYVTHSVTGSTFIYRAKESAESAAASAVRGIVDRFCGGSIERVLLGLVEASLVDAKQLDTIVSKLQPRPR